jgi:hypothetical protein
VSTMAAEVHTGAMPASRVPQDLYRLVLLRKMGSELLVAGQRPFLTLPSVEIPRWTRLAENINAAVRKRYGISTVCLFTTEPRVEGLGGGDPLYEVMETTDFGTAPADMQWLAVAALSDRSFADGQDGVEVASAMRQICMFQRSEANGPFGRPGWINQLFAWAQVELDPYGLRLNREFRQLNASPTFALLRLQTNGRAIWFKAVGEPNLPELPITVALARLFPTFVPSLIAVRREWHAWLAEESEGRTLDSVSDGNAWRQAVSTFAGFQISSLGKTDELFKAGCKDFRGPFLLSQVDSFVQGMIGLMNQQTKSAPPIVARGELQWLGERIKEALSTMATFQIPETLGHLDPNPGNVVVSPDKCVFLDWAEGYIGPPFLTIEYFLEYLLQAWPANDVLRTSVSDAYWACWANVLPASVVTQCRELAPLIAAFACAAKIASFYGAGASGDPNIGAYLRSLTRRMQREAKLPVGRSQRCSI